jgi:hypothetical protein
MASLMRSLADDETTIGLGTESRLPMPSPAPIPPSASRNTSDRNNVDDSEKNDYTRFNAAVEGALAPTSKFVERVMEEFRLTLASVHDIIALCSYQGNFSRRTVWHVAYNLFHTKTSHITMQDVRYLTAALIQKKVTDDLTGATSNAAWRSADLSAFNRRSRDLREALRNLSSQRSQRAAADVRNLGIKLPGPSSTL